ncbi:MAG TPA: hypothetical protein VEL73_04495, partial [Mycobacteriales bacterium]|nr:hypothetical protein [Mycobacteriales bacterium]
AQLIQLLVVIPFVALGAGIGYLLGVPDGAVLALVIMVLLALGSIASGMLTEPFVAGVLALLYVDRRMRAEGLDLVIGRLRMAQRPAVRLPGAPVPLPGGGW